MGFSARGKNISCGICGIGLRPLYKASIYGRKATPQIPQFTFFILWKIPLGKVLYYMWYSIEIPQIPHMENSACGIIPLP
jgi:hypothetical protein